MPETVEDNKRKERQKEEEEEEGYDRRKGGREYYCMDSCLLLDLFGRRTVSLILQLYTYFPALINLHLFLPLFPYVN